MCLVNGITLDDLVFHVSLCTLTAYDMGMKGESFCEPPKTNACKTEQDKSIKVTLRQNEEILKPVFNLEAVSNLCTHTFFFLLLL